MKLSVKSKKTDNATVFCWSHTFGGYDLGMDEGAMGARMDGIARIPIP